jgi:ElaB/YqjD/DUF883 family membrane-anchored ribosome-binding protein
VKSERIKAAVAETADEIHEDIDQAEEEINDSVDSISDRFAQIEERLHTETDRLIDSMTQISDAAKRYAHARPIAATGIAFIAGIVVARLLRR